MQREIENDRTNGGEGGMETGIVGGEARGQESKEVKGNKGKSEGELGTFHTRLIVSKNPAVSEILCYPSGVVYKPNFVPSDEAVRR